jgi:arylsulfatase A-like enzyme
MSPDLIFAALALAALAAGCRQPDPNTLLISIDTLRADHMSLYGYSRSTTPGLDRFFEEGTVYENAMSPSPCTVPSVRQFLSGGFDVQPERSPLAEQLRERGYATAAIVSQHQFHHHTDRDYSRGFDLFDLQAPEEIDRHGLSTRTATDVTDRALRWLGDGPREPFFLWLHYFDPHDPYEPPEKFRSFRSGPTTTGSGDVRARLDQPGDEETLWTTAGKQLEEQEVAELVSLYDGEIRYTDAEIGRVLSRFEELGLVERSVVALVSDHGEWLGRKGWWNHCMSLLEEEVRVPLAVRVRGRPIASRTREQAVASPLDLLPTILNLLGLVPLGDEYDGVDLHSLSEDRIGLAMWANSLAARRGEWKLYLRGDEMGLYRISSDPHEARNLVHEYPEVRAELEAHVASKRALRARMANEWVDTMRQLRAIGYVE